MTPKKFFYLILFFITCFSELQIDSKPPVLTGQVKSIFEKAKKSNNKLPFPEWSFKFKENEILYQYPLEKVDIETDDQLRYRYERMVHSTFMKPKSNSEILKKIVKLRNSSSKIASYVKKLIGCNDVQNISIYGSFLYNSIDPDDVDILVVVDSPYTWSLHQDTTFKKITGEEDPFPKISLQIIDYNTYVRVKYLNDSYTLTRGEKLAMQHLAVAGTWYLTIFGYDIRFDDPNDLKEHTKQNYLNKSIQSLNAAGARLYKSAYQYLPNESERTRLAKVVSRILITDFLIPVLDNSMTASTTVYDNLYKEIRNTKSGDKKKWSSLEKKIQDLYFEKLAQLLLIADKYGKLNEISFTNKG